MATGEKSKYTDKQKRQAKHIEEGYRDKGVSEEKSERIAWSTVNKQDGGGQKPGGSGYGPNKSAPPMKAKGGRKAYSSRSRSEAARKGWETRRRNANQR